MQNIETTRLLLRPFNHDDIQNYASWLANKQIMQFIGDGQTRNYKEAWNNLAWICGHWTLRGYGLYAVEEKQSGQVIGRIGLFYPEGWPGVELTWLLDCDYWGKGYATEGAQVCMKYAFDTLNLDQVISLIRPDNKKSLAVAKRLGMSLEGETTLSGIPVLKYVRTK
jgi:RimJ/RimL family protein N-acetyltransferase